MKYMVVYFYAGSWDFYEFGTLKEATAYASIRKPTPNTKIYICEKKAEITLEPTIKEFV